MIFVMFAMLTSITTYARNTYRPKSEHTYITGPRGGCYYKNSHGKKTYVDRSLCVNSEIKLKLQKT